MTIITEFLKSPAWRDIQTRVFTTLGLSSVGTVASALPSNVVNETQMRLIELELMTKYLAIGSYFLSGLVAITVLVRFGVWLCDRYKEKNNK